MKRIIFALMLVFLLGCAKQIEETPKLAKEGVDKMKLTSTAFKNGEAIPSEYTCQGDDLSPELTISDVPENAKSLAIIMDDPDAPAGTWVHWVAWNIPQDKTNIAKAEKLPKEGITDFKRAGYGGPCPPSGTHRYFFKLYALDTTLDLSDEATKKDLENAMQGHIIAETRLTGTYKKT